MAGLRKEQEGTDDQRLGEVESEDMRIMRLVDEKLAIAGLRREQEAAIDQRLGEVEAEENRIKRLVAEKIEERLAAAGFLPEHAATKGE